MDGVTHHTARVNGVELHYVEAGSGPLVLLLHGFPEFWYAWRHQIPALAAAGFRVIAPDLRGYNLSEKPAGVASYRMELLVADVVALARAIGGPGDAKIRLVGHDWGGVLAWNFARGFPDLVERLVVVNAPHPAALRRELKTFNQLRRSWYIGFFQLPAVPEMAIRAFDWKALRGILRDDPVRPGAFTDEDIDLYVDAFRRKGALTAAINWYRALLRYPPKRGWLPRNVEAPTLLVWGMQDRHLSRRLTEGLEDRVPRLRIERLPDVSHWVPADAPETLNRLLVDFFRS